MVRLIKTLQNVYRRAKKSATKNLWTVNSALWSIPTIIWRHVLKIMVINCTTLLPYGVGVDDIFQFAYGNHISRILVNIPENEKLLAHYRESGFHKAYLYRCYQKED